jgi:hypothetical protein
MQQFFNQVNKLKNFCIWLVIYLNYYYYIIVELLSASLKGIVCT